MQIRKKRRDASPIVDAPTSQSSEDQSPEERRRLIEEAAYFRAEKRGFMDGSPTADWLEAEAEIDRTGAQL